MFVTLHISHDRRKLQAFATSFSDNHQNLGGTRAHTVLFRAHYGEWERVPKF